MACPSVIHVKIAFRSLLSKSQRLPNCSSHLYAKQQITEQDHLSSESEVKKRQQKQTIDKGNG